MRGKVLIADQNGSFQIPGGVAARIGSGAAGTVIAFPLVAKAEDGQDTPLVFFDNGCTPLPPDPSQGGTRFPAITFIAQVPAGQAIAYIVAESMDEAYILSAGTNIAVDASGRVVVIGPGADGAAVAGNPVRVAGTDGVNTRSLLTDALGRLRALLSGVHPSDLATVEPIASDQGGYLYQTPGAYFVPVPAAAIATGVNLTAVPVLAQQTIASQWATLIVSCTNTGTNLYVAEYATDNNGQNWLPAPYAKRVDTVSGNPTVKQFWSAGNGLAFNNGEKWEFPLPGNAYGFRIRGVSGASPATLGITAGAPYVPGVPVVAVLFDVQSANNTALNTTPMDLTGWTSVDVHMTTPAGVTGQAFQVDDAGTDWNGGQYFGVSASSDVMVKLAAGGESVLASAQFGAANPYAGTLPLPKRGRFLTTAAAAVSSRIRIEARR